MHHQARFLQPPTSPPTSPSISSPHLHATTRRSGIAATPRVQRRLLVPTNRPPRLPPVVNPRSPRKNTGGKHVRGRAGSIPPDFAVSPPCEERWFDIECKFDVVQDELVIDGYQIYAVEKWIVQRTQLVTLLTVYTGDPKDKITVTVLSPPASLTEPEAAADWDKTIHSLRRDGARPRETEHGVIMITSLANFRSDYTIVHIPDGNYLAHRERLFANINLLRMGCSGRSALTLQESSDATKDRFLGTYHLGDSLRSQDPFISTVLELVKIVQAGLAIFGMFSPAPEEHNGLLCDVTVDGIQRWFSEIGEPCLKIEPMERVADPTIVSALLSMLVTVRNKLNAIGFTQAVPKDPFLEPYQFMHALATFANQRSHQQYLHIHTTNSNSSSTSIVSAPSSHVFLTVPLIRRIDTAYDKARASDAYKVHRVLLNKLDDLTSATAGAIASSSSAATSSYSGQVSDAHVATPDLGIFVTKIAVVGGKESVPSLKCLWTGRPDLLKKQRREMVWSDGEREADKDSHRERLDAKSTDEDDVFAGRPWSNKMQRKIENWAGREFGRTRMKRPSVDLTGKYKAVITGREPTSAVPSVAVSQTHYEGLSSGQVSPISPSTSMVALAVHQSPNNSTVDIDSIEYERRVTQFNQRPKLTNSWQLTTRSDPLRGNRIFEEEEDGLATAKMPRFDEEVLKMKGGDRRNSLLGNLTVVERKQLRRSITGQKRRHSFGDASAIRDTERLTVPQMEIDVELCAQYLILCRREVHVEILIASLQAILGVVSESTANLRKEFGSHKSNMDALCARSRITADIDGALNNTDEITRRANALAYEAGGFDIARMWQMAHAPRQRVFAIRERVSGTSAGKRARGRGRFNRVQHTVDGRERFVDWMGRTESEAEEERDLPEIMPDEDNVVGELTTVTAARPAGGWLLEFFTRWGKVLGVGTGTAKGGRREDSDVEVTKRNTRGPGPLIGQGALKKKDPRRD